MEWWEQRPGRLAEEIKKLVENTNSELRVMDASRVPGNLGSGLFLGWEEIIKSDSGKRYRILIVCQQDHPYSAPAAWVVEPAVRRCHHMLGDGRLCLHDPDIGPDMTWVKNARDWTCEWVHCYEIGDWRTFI